jgi:uncharacterized DUF497 family protein
MDFEWDEAKNRANMAKHGIDFDEAIQVFYGLSLGFVDQRRNYGETRMIIIGMAEGREILVVYTVRGESYRIISARRAKRDERRAYRQAQAR